MAATAMAMPAAMPWTIYADGDAADNHGVWSNIMAAGGSRLAIDPLDRARPFAGATQLRLDFTFGAAPGAWAGVAVASEPGAWGDRPAPAFDLSAAGRLVLVARGGGGGEGIRIKVAPTGDAVHGDSAPLPFDSGWLRLAADWQTITVPVDGRALGRVVIPLVVIANRAHNPTGAAVVYLDAVRFER